MVGKRTNLLREYHLLVTRGTGGFEWQIRYNRHANPVQRGEAVFPTHAEALAAGEVALAAFRREFVENPS